MRVAGHRVRHKDEEALMLVFLREEDLGLCTYTLSLRTLRFFSIRELRMAKRENPSCPS